MLSHEEAFDRLVLANAPLSAENVPLAEAAGRYLVQPLAARLTQPPADCSAMDGYAIRFGDLPGPWRVVGESAAGARFGRGIGAGEAVRIFTGAILPPGADTVLMQEDAGRDGEVLTLRGKRPERPAQHVRRAGFDFVAGAPLAAAGTPVAPALVGLAAAAGHGDLPVHRRPRVALLATGDELVPPGSLPGPDGVVGSNGVMLEALLAQAGAVVSDLGIVPDRLDAITAAIGRAAGADLLVTIGGASVGDRDLVRPALDGAGASLDFWKVAIRPGKPLLAGRLAETLVLGLPGNPVSAFVCAQLYLLPLVRRLAGCSDPAPRLLPAATVRPLAANESRRDHLRARCWRAGGQWLVEAAGTQDSAGLSVLAGSNALIVREPFAPAVENGAAVSVLPLDMF